MDIGQPTQSTGILFAEILLPLPLPGHFTYAVPQSLQNKAQAGIRAIVPFGERKVITGIILNLHNTPPHGYQVKYILEFLDDYPMVEDLQLRLFQWMADYYCCTQGEVLNAALPSGLKLSSESFVQLNPSFTLDQSGYSFTDKEHLVLERLLQGPLSYPEINKLTGTKNIYALLKSLIQKESIIVVEEVREKYKPKKEKRVRLSSAWLSEHKLQELFIQLSSRPKQEDILLYYLQNIPILHEAEKNVQGLAKSVYAAKGLSASSLQTLINNKVFEEFEITVPRFNFKEEILISPVPLNESQSNALREIHKGFESQGTILLHGVTGSGKTEIYIHLIQQALENGVQVLYLLPEIALTTQIVHRLKKHFGNNMGVYHSRFSDNERVEVWNGILSGRFKFIVGARSSVFLPFDNLGLVLVDEEHDPSYKQQDPAPRYNARDVALMLGRIHHAKTLLGSATPSVESYYHAQQGKYCLVTLDKRFGDMGMPTLVLADMKKERKQKTNKGELSRLLLEHIQGALNKKEQVIIFQNRRGYSPTVSCEVCEWVPHCVNCAVTLTYHQFRHALVCHYCGYKENLPHQCPSCNSPRILTLGYGTEKLEEELKFHFPSATVMRMDLDTTRSKTNYESIMDSFERGETQILVGTQMVTKGLDFDHVSVVGVFNADRMMNFPDFRAHERAFQLITQVSGRAGRKDKPGTVVIQTNHTEHPLLKTILAHQDIPFYEKELEERKKNAYPPFSRLLEITVKHVDKKICHALAQQTALTLKKSLTQCAVLGPGEPVIGRIKNQYLMVLLIKMPRNHESMTQIKSTVMNTTSALLKMKEFHKGRFTLDVDPA